MFHFGQILFNLARTFAARHEKSFVPPFLKVCMLRSPLITYLITLSLEKKIVVLEKSLGKVLNFGTKNLYEPRNQYISRGRKEHLMEALLVVVSSQERIIGRTGNLRALAGICEFH